MTGGNYFTWFKDEGSELRKVLYSLESKGFVLIQSKRMTNSPNLEFDKSSIEKVKKIAENIRDKDLKKKMESWSPNWTERKWTLTRKGKVLVEKDKNLQNLQKEGNALKFFTALKEKIEEKEFFIP